MIVRIIDEKRFKNIPNLKAAVKLSLQKWYNLWKGGDVEKYDQFCGLCEFYNKGETACNDCILYKKWDKDCNDTNSLYKKWFYGRNSEEKTILARLIYKDILEIYEGL